MTDTAQWFDGIGNCRCGKKATGVLRGTRNESLGPYCERCAEKRIKSAQREREKKPTAASLGRLSAEADRLAKDEWP